MADTLSKERRSALMKRVKQKNTAPELIVRKALHKRGLRYKIGDPKLPGRPDLSFPRYRAALFVHGCFWHGHDCRAGRLPTTNTDFWVPKIEGNRKRDQRKEEALRESGWRVFTVWQCELGSDKCENRLTDLAEAIRAQPSPPSSVLENLSSKE